MLKIIIKNVSRNIILFTTLLFFNFIALAEIKKRDNILYSINPIVRNTISSIVSISGIKKIEKAENINLTLSDIMKNIGNKENYKNKIIEKIGSGVIIDKKKGYIVTNAHVVSNLDKINVMLKNKKICVAKLVGLDYYSDLALIQIKDKFINSAKIANSDNLRIGDFVISIGNPYGFSHTVTYGIVSALCRNNISLNTHGYYNFIQTDAAINQGNSGGGLFNTNGQLIGINTAMVTTKNGGNMGLGLAIPSNMVRIITHQLEEGGVKRGFLGISSQDITYELSANFNYFKNHGAIISQIYPNTPAHKSDLKIGDIITHVNKKKIIDSMHLRIMISLVIPNKKISFNVFRKKRNKLVDLKIKDVFHKRILGYKVFDGFGRTELVEEKKKKNTKIKGVLISNIDYNSSLRNTSLKEGDLIIAANKVLTPSIEILKRVALKHTDTILLQILREKTKFFVVIKCKEKNI